MDRLNHLAIQPDGKAVLVGTALGGTHSKYPLLSFGTIIRLNLDGSPDPTFQPVSSAGTVGVTTRFRSLQAVALGTDGTIIVVGRQANDVTVIGRFLADGRVDRTFGSNGVMDAQRDPGE